MNQTQLLQLPGPPGVEPLLPGRRSRPGGHLRAAARRGQARAQGHPHLQDALQALRAAQRAPPSLLAAARHRQPGVQRGHDQKRDRGWYPLLIETLMGLGRFVSEYSISLLRIFASIRIPDQNSVVFKSQPLYMYHDSDLTNALSASQRHGVHAPAAVSKMKVKHQDDINALALCDQADRT